MTDQGHRLKVLFVCMGNICRSPAAEGVFREYLRKAGHAGAIYVDSAGTIDYHAGSLPDARMREAASRRGYSLESLARQVLPDDIGTFDLIIVMDHVNLKDLAEIAGGEYAHVRMLGSFLENADTPEKILPVPDPYYGGAAGFERVLDMIEAACPAILDYCLELLEGRPDDPAA